MEHLLALKPLLDQKVKEINVRGFITDDPISIPKQYSKKQDIEITAFWVAMLAWGQRKTIINKSNELFGLMGNEPYKFICTHREKDRKRFENFKHRTFQYTDTLYFLEFLQRYYQENDSLERLFSNHPDMKSALSSFHDTFFELPDAPQRTRKHVATPARNSTCKRLNMFLRWMVRSDEGKVDFGIWKSIPTEHLMIPFDVHVERVARSLGILNRKQRDWKAVEELTQNLKQLDPKDPVKYDYALYGMGILGEL
ncbi:MAG: TIGR02757 family protein [Saprospiraceae bacterium]|nr:TIGR02757 family protein [Saprospiraceae bacterium]